MGQGSQSAGGRALTPAWEELGDCCPAVAQLFVRRDYDALLRRSEVIAAQHRVQLIVPPQATALTVAVANALCDEGPVPGAVGLDEKTQARIFLFSFFFFRVRVRTNTKVRAFFRGVHHRK